MSTQTKLFRLLALPFFAVGLAFPFVQAEEPNPYLQPNNTWISLSGTVVSADPDGFRLDYGEGLVTVEMDDWDWYAEGHTLLEGDRVNVYGMVDDDLYEVTSIEASSVYVENLNTYFYASAADEEDVPFFTLQTLSPQLEIIGTITDVNGREFTLDAGSRTVTVDTMEMEYNPLDDEGYQQLDAGDLVQVSGVLEADTFEGRELEAETVITLIRDIGKSGQES